jgi:hypothetical protein
MEIATLKKCFIGVITFLLHFFLSEVLEIEQVVLY